MTPPSTTALPHRCGMPNWASCVTTDLAGAELFYARVFGWQAQRETLPDGPVHSIQHFADHPVAGLVQPRTPAAPRWEACIEVDDLDAALNRARAAGGVVLDAPTRATALGDSALIADPFGAPLRLWVPEAGRRAGLYNTPGAMTWNELLSSDPERAARFYAEVLKLEVEQVFTGPDPYFSLHSNGLIVLGILQKPEGLEDLPDGWEVYFAVDDVSACVTRVIEAGGKVIRPPFDLPVGGSMAIVQDPQGAVFDVTTPRLSVYGHAH